MNGQLCRALTKLDPVRLVSTLRIRLQAEAEACVLKLGPGGGQKIPAIWHGDMVCLSQNLVLTYFLSVVSNGTALLEMATVTRACIPWQTLKRARYFVAAAHGQHAGVHVTHT